ncbi:MAG: CBS domain-containing protein [Candidatus Aenigmarchaeota archaeon]|nr:CBS domain-containing protein [Candidatus Aenigmarchaeota archaeon]
MKVRDVMTRRVITLDPKMDLKKAIQVLGENEISGAPVLEKNKVVGIVSESDIISIAGRRSPLGLILSFKDRRFPKQVERLTKVKVRKIMRKKVVTILEDAEISEAAKMMSRHNINRLPVVDKRKNLVGIVTRGDLVKTLALELAKAVIRGEAKRPEIETDIDKLLKIINERNRISLDKASKELKISEGEIERWAKALRDHGLIELEYPLVGKAILKRKER